MKHRWTSQKTYVPGEPDDWYCYCEDCGDELDEDNRNEECRPYTTEDMGVAFPIVRVS